MRLHVLVRKSDMVSCERLDISRKEDYSPVMDEQGYIPILYGRRQDKTLRPGQAALFETLLPKIACSNADGDFVPVSSLFSESREIWLEVGFGGGEHLAWHAARNRDVGLIGAEPFVNGVAKLLTKIDSDSLENVRVHFGDARPLMESIGDGVLSRIFVLHPDPWPKRRHFKRRIISPWFFEAAARLLKPGGELRVASDIPDYIRWTLMHARQAPHFEWTARSSADWKERREDWPQTRYEAKAVREGRIPTYLSFRRL